MKMYLAECFTGATSQSVFSSLDNAKAAIEAHATAVYEHDPGVWLHARMQWIEYGGAHAMVPHNWDQTRLAWGQNQASGLMENISIVEFEVDEPMPFV